MIAASVAWSASISIHTPLAGSDASYLHFNLFSAKFQSTLPSRGVTLLLLPLLYLLQISIHTPLAGSDGTKPTAFTQLHNFNPHSPRGE